MMPCDQRRKIKLASIQRVILLVCLRSQIGVRKNRRLWTNTNGWLRKVTDQCFSRFSIGLLNKKICLLMKMEEEAYKELQRLFPLLDRLMIETIFKMKEDGKLQGFLDTPVKHEEAPNELLLYTVQVE